MSSIKYSPKQVIFESGLKNSYGSNEWVKRNAS